MTKVFSSETTYSISEMFGINRGIMTESPSADSLLLYGDHNSIAAFVEHNPRCQPIENPISICFLLNN